MMKKFSVALAAIVLSSLAGSAFAASATGTVTALDVNRHFVTLDNGTTYFVPRNFDFYGVERGKKVTVTFETIDGVNEASAIVPAN